MRGLPYKGSALQDHSPEAVSSLSDARSAAARVGSLRPGLPLPLAYMPGLKAAGRDNLDRRISQVALAPAGLYVARDTLMDSVA